MSKNNDHEIQTNEAAEPRRDSAGRKVLRFFGRTVDLTIDLTANSIIAVFKVIGTVLMILMVTGMMFACVFAYYVKTCLTPNLDLSLEDFKLNESSTVWYRDGGGEWRELVNLSGREKRVWANYEDIPWYMERPWSPLRISAFTITRAWTGTAPSAPLWRCLPVCRPATAAPPSPSSSSKT